MASSTLTGGVANVAGQFAFNSPSTVPTLGSTTQNITFTPTDTTTYNIVQSTAAVTTARLTPTITWPTANVINGLTLASSTLTGGVANVAGQFTFNDTTIVPALGLTTQNITFTPTDTTTYDIAQSTATVTTARLTPTITTQPTANVINGQTLASSTLTGGVATYGATPVYGIFTFSSPSTVPTLGSSSQPVLFTPTNFTTYNSATGYATVTAYKITPTITPPTATVTYGQMLATSTLVGGVATFSGANVAGLFTFLFPSTISPI